MVCEGQNLTLLHGFVTIQSVDHVKVLNRDDSEETTVLGIRSSRKSKDRTGRQKCTKDFISARCGMTHRAPGSNHLHLRLHLRRREERCVFLISFVLLDASVRYKERLKKLWRTRQSESMRKKQQPNKQTKRRRRVIRRKSLQFFTNAAAATDERT